MTAKWETRSYPSQWEAGKTFEVVVKSAGGGLLLQHGYPDAKPRPGDHYLPIQESSGAKLGICFGKYRDAMRAIKALKALIPDWNMVAPGCTDSVLRQKVFDIGYQYGGGPAR